ncbi:hypothetical protein [Hathewaya limosa]|uniref:Uncharacterized protein n=1 Tax=Hathewaya limosa TaxID=1536 RepID=A0ABU0JQ31_HATLI|nr:hypothetical protein [Hathewaya limosa]AWZ49196.1 hypothetical protein C3495_10365 [Clostridiaceae bacterium 14S0207]MDQ0478525.1 hypothetical protein [Hathewaya limosa]
MENCLSFNTSSCKNIEDYKNDIKTNIIDILDSNEKLNFALVVKKSNISPIIIKKYPELRIYILENIDYYKEIKMIDNKISKATTRILASKESLTFMAIMKRCRFTSTMMYKNSYIKEKVIKTIKENKNSIKL